MEEKIQAKRERTQKTQEANEGETLTAQKVESEIRNVFKRGYIN